MITLGLQRIKQLLQPLFQAHPHHLPWRAVHIAGTNGKGSVAALISTFLGHLGYRVGRFTSPHTIDRWDCIHIDKAIVPRDKFLPLEQHFRDRSAAERISASEFEILTATAFQLFADEKVDVAVVECGLGGREDATNVLRPQDVVLSVLTKVGLDHVEFLGNTIAAITGEKVGIFKPGVHAVLDRSNEAEVIEVAMTRLKDLGWGSDGRDGIYVSPEEQEDEFKDVISRLGLASHQAQNLYTAWSAFRQVGQTLRALDSHEPLQGAATLSPSSPERSVKPCLKELILEARRSLPGRLQWLDLPTSLLPFPRTTRHDTNSASPSKPRVLLDGAHNTQSATALSSYISTHLRTSSPEPARENSTGSGSGSVTWLLAMKNDKDVDQILSLLLKPNDNVVTCSFGPVDGMPWVKAMHADELAERAKMWTQGEVRAFLPLEDRDENGKGDGDRDATLQRHDKERSGNRDEYMATVIRDAVGLAADAPLCIAGSLYLVGDVLRCVRNAATSN